MDSRVVWILVGVVIVVLGGWYIVAHQNFTSSLPSADTYSATTTPTAPSAVSPSVPAGQSPLGGAASTPDLPTVQADAIGSWQSTDDPNYSVQITSGGKWTDTYAGSASSSASQTGMYELFTSQNPDPDFTGILEPGVVYVKVVEGKSTLYFSVLASTANTLQLSYLDRGNTLSFTRVQ